MNGTPNNGSLENDESLSPNSGTGYYHFLGTDTADTDDWGCPDHIHDMIIAVGNSWNQSPRMGVVDISKEGGGYWSPHSAHQNGRDVDIRYVRSDGVEGSYNFDLDTSPYPGYDQEATQELVNLFIAEGATVIYVDSRSGIPEVGGVAYYVGHQHHFHVRY